MTETKIAMTTETEIRQIKKKYITDRIRESVDILVAIRNVLEVLL